MKVYLINAFISVATGVIAAAIYGRLSPPWRDRRYERALAKFWRFKHKLLYIVRPGYRSPSGEDVGENMARVEDVLAIDAITTMLKRRNIRYYVVDHSATIPLDVDIVLVCSAKGNRASAEVMKTLPLPYSFEMNDPAKAHFIDKETGVEYRSPMDTDGAKKDISLIGRYTKGSGQVVFLLWGTHGVGTLGAAKCAVDLMQLEHLNREVGDRDFSVLVECKFITKYDVETCRLLTEPRIAGE